MLARELIKEGETRLRRSPAIDHWPADREQREAAALLAHVLGLDGDDPEPRADVDARTAHRYRKLVRRRAGGEPMAHILGWTEFRGMHLRIKPGAFVPRQSSEWLVEQAVRRLRRRREPVAVDVATGMGPIALAVAHEVPRADVHGTDLLGTGLRQARANAKRLGIGNVSFHTGDTLDPLPAHLKGRVDVITAHPPYVPRDEVQDLPLEVRGFEPERTLTDYSDAGMYVVERTVWEGREWLREGGWLLLEVSPDRTRAVRGLMQRAGYTELKSTNGWPQITRTVVGKR